MMTELSLNVLDIAQNSIKAKSSRISVSVCIDTSADSLVIKISDDGCGMSPEQLKQAEDPFYSTRSTRKIGLGISFFKQAAELTGGSFSIDSVQGQGTNVKADFVLSHIDRIPLGDINATIQTLILHSPGIDIVYDYRVDESHFTLSTAEMREKLGDISLNTPDVAEFIKNFLKENTNECNKILLTKGISHL